MLYFIVRYSSKYSIDSFSLGMSHDNDKSPCASKSSSNGDTIMVPSYARVPSNMWSRCSRDTLTDVFE